MFSPVTNAMIICGMIMKEINNNYRKSQNIYIMKMFEKFLLIIAVICVSYFTGCTVVKPIERERLSDPNMIFDENPIEQGIQNHYLYIREGSKGADGAKSGGCGCG